MRQSDAMRRAVALGVIGKLLRVSPHAKPPLTGFIATLPSGKIYYVAYVHEDANTPARYLFPWPEVAGPNYANNR